MEKCSNSPSTKVLTNSMNRENDVDTFFDNQGIVHTEFMQKGTIDAATYCEALSRLRKTIKERSPGKLSKGVALLHGNATPHSACVGRSNL